MRNLKYNLIFIGVCFFLMGCSNSENSIPVIDSPIENEQEVDVDNNDEETIELKGSITKYTTQLQDTILPRLVFHDFETNTFITVLYKHDENGIPLRITHLIAENEGSLSTIASFDITGRISSIYSQDVNSGEVDEELLIANYNEKTYIGSVEESIEIDKGNIYDEFEKFSDSEVDVLFANTMNSNRAILGDLENYANSNPAKKGANITLAGAAFVLFGLAVLYYGTKAILSSPAYNNFVKDISQDCGINSSNKRYSSSLKEKPNIYSCLNNENIINRLNQDTQFSAYICDGNICITLPGVDPNDETTWPLSRNAVLARASAMTIIGVNSWPFILSDDGTAFGNNGLRGNWSFNGTTFSLNLSNSYQIETTDENGEPTTLSCTDGQNFSGTLIGTREFLGSGSLSCSCCGSNQLISGQARVSL